MDVDYSRVQAEETFSINVELVEKFFTACTDEDTLDVDQNSLLLSQFTDFYHTVYQQAQTTNDDQQRKTLNKEAQIWKLLMQLTEFNHDAEEKYSQSLEHEESFISPEAAVVKLCENDLEYNQAKLILNWLEETFLNELDENNGSLDYRFEKNDIKNCRVYKTCTRELELFSIFITSV